MRSDFRASGTHMGALQMFLVMVEIDSDDGDDSALASQNRAMAVPLTIEKRTPPRG